MKQPVLLRGVADIDKVLAFLAEPEAKLVGAQAGEDMLRQRVLEHFAKCEQLPDLVLVRGAGRISDAEE